MSDCRENDRRRKIGRNRANLKEEIFLGAVRVPRSLA